MAKGVKEKKTLPAENKREGALQSHRSNNGEDLITEYLEEMRRSGLSDSAVKNSLVVLNRYFRWLDRRGISHPGEADLADLEAFVVWLSRERRYRGRLLGLRTRGNYIVFLKAFYRYLKREGMIYFDPTGELKHPKEPKRMPNDALTLEEAWHLLGAPDQRTPEGLRDHLAMRLLLFCGLRARELGRLNVGEVDLEGREIIVRQGKGRKDRLVFFDSLTRSVLAEYLVAARPALVIRQDPATLIVNDRGEPMSNDALRKRILRYRNEAGIGRHLTCHSLRRSFCTLLLSAGCNIKVIADLAGHKRLETTERYTRVFAGEVSAAYRETHPRGRS